MSAPNPVAPPLELFAPPPTPELLPAQDNTPPVEGQGKPTTTNKRKRKRDRVSERPDDVLTPEQLAARNKRRELNKEASRQCRARRSQRVAELEQAVEELTRRNEEMSNLLNTTVAENAGLRDRLDGGAFAGVEGERGEPRVWSPLGAPRIVGKAMIAVVLMATLAANQFAKTPFDKMPDLNLNLNLDVDAGAAWERLLPPFHDPVLATPSLCSLSSSGHSSSNPDDSPSSPFGSEFDLCGGQDDCGVGIDDEHLAKLRKLCRPDDDAAQAPPNPPHAVPMPAVAASPAPLPAAPMFASPAPLATLAPPVEGWHAHDKAEDGEGVLDAIPAALGHVGELDDDAAAWGDVLLAAPDQGCAPECSRSFERALAHSKM